MATSPDQLDALVEFDHPFRVAADGNVTDAPTGVYAPSVYDETIDDPEWAFWSTGYSGQDSYSGPIMHNSEYLGGSMARDLLSEPGIYAVVAAYWSSEDDDDDAESIAEGWAVVRYVGDDAG